MYTLHKAKEEIDAIAKHVTAVAGHAMTTGDSFEAKLESFKRDIISTIEARFAALEKTIMGDTSPTDSTALSDLDAKVALLIHGAPPPAAHDPGTDPHHPPAQDQSGHDQAGHDQAGHDQTGHDQSGHDHGSHDQNDGHQGDHHPQ